MSSGSYLWLATSYGNLRSTFCCRMITCCVHNSEIYFQYVLSEAEAFYCITDEVSGQSFRSQIPEVTIHAPDDSRTPPDQTTSSTAADDRSRVVKSPGESAELLVGKNSVPKVSLSLPQISLGQDEEGDLDLDSNGFQLDSTILVESLTDASSGDVFRFKSNDVSKTSTSANCNATQIKPDNIVNWGSPSYAVNQMGNNYSIAKGDINLNDDVSPNTTSLSSRNATADDFTVLIVSAKGGAKNPLAMANGDSCKKQALSSSNIEVGNSTQSVLDERSTPIFVSTPKPCASDSASSPATVGLNATHSNSFPVCSGNTNSRPPLLKAVGLVWSRSQELQPRDSSHDSLSTSKMALVTRRRSAQCVCTKRHTVENLNK